MRGGDGLLTVMDSAGLYLAVTLSRSGRGRAAGSGARGGPGLRRAERAALIP